MSGAAIITAAIGSKTVFGKSEIEKKAAEIPYVFPEGLFTDVRIEDSFETAILNRNGTLEQLRERKYQGAFIRVFDGKRWYTSATTDLAGIQGEIDLLAKMAKPDPKIAANAIVKAFQVNTGNFIRFGDADISSIPQKSKLDILERFIPSLGKYELIKDWSMSYNDNRRVKKIFSSKGTNLIFDFQTVGFAVAMTFIQGDKNFSEMFDGGCNTFEELEKKADSNLLNERIKLGEVFLTQAVPVKPGKYPVVLSPAVAGVFAHESFGHKSEADFMIGDETMMKEWTVGKKVGSEILSIVDDGNYPGTGYIQFDDDGNRSQETYLIRNGVLAGRLHSAKTAGILGEATTGNSRALDFTFEPIVRMTSTYIKPGNETKEQLISHIRDGFFIDTLKHGSGMSTFTIAPLRAYKIRDGKVQEPVQISVISGNVFETLNLVDGVSDVVEVRGLGRGGCGKMAQYPLPVNFGGPFVRVKEMDVR
ncbi:MAG: TldD/PmbA family protein [Candidatus Riflebacteria bacterium]|nr:TldD/PmbA family protein [Candidatus Riflebacteria bacterium]